jgi:hypothetical protein
MYGSKGVLLTESDDATDCNAGAVGCVAALAAPPAALPAGVVLVELAACMLTCAGAAAVRRRLSCTPWLAMVVPDSCGWKRLRVCNGSSGGVSAEEDAMEGRGCITVEFCRGCCCT